MLNYAQHSMLIREPIGTEIYDDAAALQCIEGTQ